MTPRAGPWTGSSVTRSPTGPCSVAVLAHDGDARGAHLGGDRGDAGMLGAGEQQDVGEEVVEPPAVAAEHVDAARPSARAASRASSRSVASLAAGWRSIRGARGRRPWPAPPATTESKSPTARSIAQARAPARGRRRSRPRSRVRRPGRSGEVGGLDGVAAGDHHHHVARARRCHRDDSLRRHYPVQVPGSVAVPSPAGHPLSPAPRAPLRAPRQGSGQRTAGTSSGTAAPARSRGRG